MVINDDTLPDPPTLVDYPASASVDVHYAVSGWGAASSVGMKREVNEDRFGRQSDVFAIADGMGGHSGGVEASECAIEAVLRHAVALGTGAPLGEWRALVRIVNIRVRTAMQSRGYEKAGCTLTMVAVEANRIVATHVGDSRLYELHSGVLTQRTEDHNLLGELTQLGSGIDHAATRGLPLAGLTSYIGQSDESLRVDAFEWHPENGTRLLLSTDGVHRYVQEATIADVVAGFSPMDAAVQLTQRADAAGGRDNATALVVQL